MENVLVELGALQDLCSKTQIASTFHFSIVSSFHPNLCWSPLGREPEYIGVPWIPGALKAIHNKLTIWEKNAPKEHS